MQCTNCGQTAQPGLARCGHCNYKLPEQAQPTASEDGKVNCWNCKHDNEAHHLRCMQCNAKLDKSATPKRQVVPVQVEALTPNTLSHDK